MLSMTRGAICGSIALSLVIAAGCATLHGPARRGEVSAVVEQISGGADIEARDGDGNTPLHVAVLNGHESVVTALLAAGADVRARNSYGATPLHYWGLGEHTTDVIASALLEAGAHIGARDHDGSTPLHWATARGTQSQASRSSTSLPSVSDSLPVVARLPVIGMPFAAARVALAPLDALITLLNLFSGTPRLVENTTVLVSHGADVGARDDNGNAPLHWAAVTDAPADVVTALLSAGADGAARNAAGDIPADLVPDDSILWSLLISSRTTLPSEGGTPDAVRDLRVTRSTELVAPEFDSLPERRRWKWTWTWDKPNSDGGHPITKYMHNLGPCDDSSVDAETFHMTRARADDQSFINIHENEGYVFPTLLPPIVDRTVGNDTADFASIWAVNARGNGTCTQVNIVDR